VTVTKLIGALVAESITVPLIVILGCTAVCASTKVESKQVKIAVRNVFMQRLSYRVVQGKSISPQRKTF
jgi:hypothetical protein